MGIFILPLIILTMFVPMKHSHSGAGCNTNKAHIGWQKSSIQGGQFSRSKCIGNNVLVWCDNWCSKK